MAKELLIQYVVTKAVYIEHELGFKNHINSRDIADLQKWSEDECIKVFEYIKKFHNAMTRFTCPWCVKYGLNCNECTYGERHLKCYEHDSDYVKLRKLVSDKYGQIPLLDIPGLKEEAEKILNTPYNTNYETFCKVNEIEDV